MKQNGKIKGLVRWAWALVFSSIGAAFVLGILFWGGFNTVMKWTNTEQFCITCHEMQDNVYQEYRYSPHSTSASGVRAVCSDCHVPKEFGPKMLRKLYASKELLHHFLGTVNTPEKFNAKRPILAQNEWRRMKANDSQECRNCHTADSFDYALQGSRASQQHQQGFARGETCIDCHKGIAHTLPPIEQPVGLPKNGIPSETFHPQ